MKQLLILLFILLFTIQALAQSPLTMQIKGSIHDKETNIGLQNASIICLYAKDSSRAALSFTDKNGNFIFDSLPRKNFILYITYIGYQPLMYNAKVPLQTEHVDVGNIQIKRTGLTLSEVEILQAKPPVKITKDTIEFNASQFKTKDNASVEDLFKKISGIQIDQDGTIRMNGQVIKSVMVNGRLLLGSGDPKTISRNLQADLIDKVQVITKNTENGLNSGETNKVINITIKKNKQNIISGELGGSIGSSDRFATKANVSRFKEHQQILLIGNGNNTNGIPDINYVSSGGLTRTWSAAGSYIEDLSKKTTINAGYSMDNKFNTEQQNNLKQNFIGDSILFNNKNSSTNSYSTNHVVFIQLEYKLDSLQKITFSSNNLLSNNRDIIASSYESTVNNRNINTGLVNNSGESKLKALSSGLTYEKRFKKNGRSLNINLSYSAGVSVASQFNTSRNSYFLYNGETSGDTLNQNSNINNKNKKILVYINYTEPIIKGGFLTFFFGRDQTNSSYDKSTFNYNTTTKLYDKYIDTMSVLFRNTSIQHCERISWFFQKGKFNYDVSLSSLFYNFNNSDLNRPNNLSQNNAALLPSVNLGYTLDNNKEFRLRYSKEVRFPDITQLQPIPDVSDPLNVKLGNPGLKPMSIHRINFSYNTFNTISLRSLYISISSDFTNNQIINDSKTDSIGKQITQPFNHSGGYSISFNLTGGLPVKKRTNSITTITQSTLQKSMNYINGEKNINDKLSITQSISYRSESTKLFDYLVSGNINYNNIRLSNMADNNTSYLNFGVSSTVNLNFPLGITMSTFLSYNYSSGLTAAYNNNVWILNATISKSLFRYKQGIIAFQGIDLLKQNKSITRNVQVDYIEDIRTNTLNPFFLVKFSYFLGKGKN